MRIAFAFICLLASLSIGAQNWTALVGQNNQDGWEVRSKIDIKTEAGYTTIASGGDKAWLRSKDDYANFDLRGEFALGDIGSGKIIFRIQEQDDPWADLTGYSVIFDRNPDQQNTLGSIENVSRAKWIDSLDFDSWNSFEISANADHLKVFINNQLVCETHHRRSINGMVKIQLDNSAIQFRNLQIKENAPDVFSRPTTEDYLHAFPADYKSLFDGKTLSGWQGTGTSEWKISNNSLHGYSGAEGGFLVSKKAYQNFHLKFKFKIIKEDNSGIFIRKPANSDEITLENSIECNIYDHNGFTHAFSTGALVRHARAWNSMIDFSDWNTGDIFALNDHIVMYINGMKASEAHLPDFNHSGQLCLQAGLQLALPEKGPSDVYFKDLWIKCIDGL